MVPGDPRDMLAADDDLALVRLTNPLADMRAARFSPVPEPGPHHVDVGGFCIHCGTAWPCYSANQAVPARSRPRAAPLERLRAAQNRFPFSS
jgi:hypothetical protein